MQLGVASNGFNLESEGWLPASSMSTNMCHCLRLNPGHGTHVCVCVVAGAWGAFNQQSVTIATGLQPFCYFTTAVLPRAKPMPWHTGVSV